MLKEQEGAALAQGFKRNPDGDPGSNPSTPRAPGTGEQGFFTTPQKVGAIPADANTGCKKPSLAPRSKKSRWDRGASPVGGNLGRNLQLKPQTGDAGDFNVREDGYLAGDRAAFTIDDSNGLRTVAGKAVQFAGRRYVHLEKNIGTPASPKYAHGGVLEKSADGSWRVRQRYVPAMSLGLAGIHAGLPLARVKHLERMVQDGLLNNFFGSGNLRRVRDIADQWTREYPRRITNWDQDAKVFGNNEGKLPINQSSLELTCRDKSGRRGEMRLVLDRQGHLLFTPDHYRTFILLTASTPKRVHINALPMSVESTTGGLFDPHHVAGLLLGKGVAEVRRAFGDNGLFVGKVFHPFQAVSEKELARLRAETGLNLSPGFSSDHCRRIRGTGMVVALPPSRDDSRPPRVFVEGYVGTRFSEVVSDKDAATSLAYFKV